MLNLSATIGESFEFGPYAVDVVIAPPWDAYGQPTMLLVRGPRGHSLHSLRVEDVLHCDADHAVMYTKQRTCERVQLGFLVDRSVRIVRTTRTERSFADDVRNALRARGARSAGGPWVEVRSGATRELEVASA